MSLALGVCTCFWCDYVYFSCALNSFKPFVFWYLKWLGLSFRLALYLSWAWVVVRDLILWFGSRCELNLGCYNKKISCVISVVVEDIALYSASVLDFEILVCFLALQETRLDPRKMQYPDVDRRVFRYPAQSVSLYAFRSSDEDADIRSPWSNVAFKYLRICFATDIWYSIGECMNWHTKFTA